MRCTLICSVFVLLVCAPVSAAPSEIPIDSGGSRIILTVWETESDPASSLLLIPGWGGGPTDVMGIGEFLSANGVEVIVPTPRGWHESEGDATFANALDDIGEAWVWIRARDMGPAVVGGHSWGGGMSLAYAARDTTVRRVFSIAGTDHAQFIRLYAANPDYKAMVDRILTASSVPEGPVRFDVAYGMEELQQGQQIYGLIENAGRLSDRSILLIGGWEDQRVTVDETMLPLYRSLRAEGAEDVTFITYHANHSFKSVRGDLHQAILDWILR